jgi:hypothetical protein
MLCPNITNDFVLKETFRSKVPIYLYITLTACDNSSASCVASNALQYLTNQSAGAGDGASIISVYVLDKAVVPDRKDPIDYYVNIDTNIPISNSFGGVAIVEF